MKTIAILGGSGMLGSMLIDFFSHQKEYTVIGALRDDAYKEIIEKKYPHIQWVHISTDYKNKTSDLDAIPNCDWIINAIGITKPLVKDDDPEQIERAIWVNAIFPKYIGEFAQTRGARVLQIATDCVYSGIKGQYVESDAHDSLDVYGKTKSLGECYLANVKHLRCSIIGPEKRNYKFLLTWFLSQSRGATVNGFSNHVWNGITTLHFAKICHGIISHDIELPHLHHVVPINDITKDELLKLFSHYYNREDININTIEAPLIIDRTLRTANTVLNKDIWNSAGYLHPPTIEQMIQELSNVRI